MIKVEVIEKFNLKNFDEIKDTLKRKAIDVEGQLFVGDTFECSRTMADYLLGDNPVHRAVVRIIEIEPVKDAVFTEKKSTDAVKVVASRPSKNKKK